MCSTMAHSLVAAAAAAAAESMAAAQTTLADGVLGAARSPHVLCECCPRR